MVKRDLSHEDCWRMDSCMFSIRFDRPIGWLHKRRLKKQFEELRGLPQVKSVVIFDISRVEDVWMSVELTGIQGKETHTMALERFLEDHGINVKARIRPTIIPRYDKFKNYTLYPSK